MSRSPVPAAPRRSPILYAILCQVLLADRVLASIGSPGGALGSLVAYLKTQPTRLLMVGVCIVVVLFILGKLGGSVVTKLLRGLVYGTIVSLILWFAFPAIGLSRDLVPLIGMVAFALGAIFGRVRI